MLKKKSVFLHSFCSSAVACLPIGWGWQSRISLLGAGKGTDPQTPLQGPDSVEGGLRWAGNPPQGEHQARFQKGSAACVPAEMLHFCRASSARWLRPPWFWRYPQEGPAESCKGSSAASGDLGRAVPSPQCRSCGAAGCRHSSEPRPSGLRSLPGWDGMGWDGMRWDGMRWDGMGWDGMGCNAWCSVCAGCADSGSVLFCTVETCWWRVLHGAAGAFRRWKAQPSPYPRCAVLSWVPGAWLWVARSPAVAVISPQELLAELPAGCGSPRCALGSIVRSRRLHQSRGCPALPPSTSLRETISGEVNKQ